MECTAEKNPFEINRTFDDVGMNIDIIKHMSNYAYYKRAVTDEEKSVAVNGCVWHVVMIRENEEDLTKSTTEHFIYPGVTFTELIKQVEPNGHSFRRKKRHDKLDYYQVIPVLWDNKLVFRLYKLHLNVITGNSSLFFNEIERIIVYQDKILIENKNKITEAEIGWFFNKKNVAYNCIFCFEHIKNWLPEIFNEETSKRILDCYNDNVFFTNYTIRGFFAIYSRCRYKTIINKNVPDCIMSDFSNERKYYSDYSDRKLLVLVRNTEHYMLLTTIEWGYESEKLYVSNNKFYAFDRNTFHSEWSFSRKRLNMYNVSSSELVTDDCSDYKAVKKIFKKGIKMHTLGRSKVRLNACDKPILQFVSAQYSVVAEQALKMGFYNLSNCESVSCWNGKISGSYNIFSNKKYKNLIDFFGLSGSVLNQLPRDIDKDDLRSLFNFDSFYKKNKNMYNLDYNELIRLGLFYDAINAELSWVNNYYREHNRDFNKILYVIEKRTKKERRKNRSVNDEDWYLACQFIQLFYDYYHMREDAEMYCENHGLNEHFPEIVKLSRLNYMHDRALVYSNNFRRERGLKKYDEGVKNSIQKQEYKELSYRTNDYSIILPMSAIDIFNEGAILSHCVGGYIPAVSNGSTYILFLRKNNNIDKPFLTLEVLDKNLKQCYGFRDCINTDIKVKEFIEEWAVKKDILINCSIYINR